MKKTAIYLLAVLFTTVLFLSVPVHAAESESVIVATGQSVPMNPIKENYKENYLIPEKYQDNAVQFITEDGILLSGIVLGEGNKGITLGHASGWMVRSWLPFAERLVSLP